MNDIEPHRDSAPTDLSALLEDAPPPDQEARVRAALRARGKFAAPRAWRAAAAAAVVFAAGIAVGVAWERDRAADRSASPRPIESGLAGAEPAWALVLVDGPDWAAAADPAEADRRVAALSRWARRLAAAGRLVIAEELGPPAATLSAEGQATPETFGLGIFLVRAPDAEAAAAIAVTSPHLDHGGRVVVQPVVPH